eukprot:g22844.t1
MGGDGGLRHVVHKRVHLERHQPKSRRKTRSAQTWSFNQSLGRQRLPWFESLDLLRQAQKSSLSPDQVSYLIVTRGERRAKGAVAASLLEDASTRAIEANVAFSSSVVDCLARDTSWEEALDLIEDMKRQGPQPTDFAFSAMMRGLGPEHWEDALLTLQEMPCQWDAVSVGATVASCVEAWEWATMIATQRRYDLRPNAITCSSLIHTYESASRWEAAMIVVERTLGNVVALAAALSTLEKQITRWKEALGLLNSHHRRRTQAGDDWYVLSNRWWDLWKDYTLYDSKTELPSQPAHLSRSCSGTTKGERPPGIDNSDLILRPGCPQLQSGLVENRDFILINKELGATKSTLT